MKNFTLLMIAVFMCSMVFGQYVPKQGYLPNNKNVTTQELNDSKASGWYGYQNTAGMVYDVPEGYSYYMVGSAFAQNGQIEKIKFFHYVGDVEDSQGNFLYETTCTNYTIEIYVNPTLNAIVEGAELYATYIGAPIFTQTLTVPESENEKYIEVTLSEPYPIPPSTTYWIGIKCNNGRGVCLQNPASAVKYKNQYYLVADFTSTLGAIVLMVNDFGTQQESKYNQFGMAFYVNDGSGVSNITTPTFKVYPNPSTDVFNVFVQETSIVNVYDVTGKLVNTAHVNAGEVYTFNQTTAGMYFVNVNGRVQKVVIE